MSSISDILMWYYLMNVYKVKTELIYTFIVFQNQDNPKYRNLIDSEYIRNIVINSYKGHMEYS